MVCLGAEAASVEGTSHLSDMGLAKRPYQSLSVTQVQLIALAPCEGGWVDEVCNVWINDWLMLSFPVCPMSA